ncbi:putative cardiolipin synthase YbhO [mine drainage metagenome]|uniref:Putative cardiolipin synthase YbhO n=1 Tax=mine drainage metagenome TaxID=410659 RepID=A0A1J5T9V0_9ZZZZ
MTHFISGNQIKLLRNGAEYFPALEAAIENAEHEVYLQTYIYEADETGQRIGHALKLAAQRGVNVNVLLDGFGCKDLSKDYVHELETAGVHVIFYRPKISPWTLKKSRLRRLHRKVAVIDNTIGFVGGINIIDDYHVPHNAPPRIDYAVRVEGALLPIIAASVHNLWRRIAWAHLQHAMTTIRKPAPHFPLHHISQASAYNIKAAFVVRDNLLHRRDIEQAYLSAIQHAKSEIILANAYFVPGRKFRKALIDAAQRGVSVKLLLQGRREYFLMFATHAFYSVFLKNGIEIYEYRKSFMHSKVAVIDRHWATVGSSNIDPFSLLLGHEANILVQNAHFADELRASIISSMNEGAYFISHQEWARGNIAKRFISWIAYGLVRALLGLIGYSSEK